MCIALYYINANGNYRFVLLFNREEFSDRPTEKLKVILNNGSDIIIGGQDKLQSGTWLALNIANGAIAFLTNRNELFSSSYYQTIFQLKNRLRFKYPKIMQYFFPTLKSRGKLITNLVERMPFENELINCNFQLENQHLNCNLHNTNIKEESCTKTKLIQAYLNRDQYMGYNLFVGNIINEEFYLFSSSTTNYQKVSCSGTVCSYSNIGQTQVEKERVAKEKFLKIVESTDSNIENLFEELFKLAQDEIRSSQTFFKAFPEESMFFIPEYTTKFGRKRGTRTTTILIYDGKTIQMKEKTYI